MNDGPLGRSQMEANCPLLARSHQVEAVIAVGRERPIIDPRQLLGHYRIQLRQRRRG